MTLDISLLDGWDLFGKDNKRIKCPEFLKPYLEKVKDHGELYDLLKEEFKNAKTSEESDYLEQAMDGVERIYLYCSGGTK